MKKIMINYIVIILCTTVSCNDSEDSTPKNQCESLAGIWQSGTAEKIEGNFDVSSCVRIAGRNSEVVAPALRDARWDKARCNDGSPFLFEVNMVEERSVNDWIILLQGGFLCNDDQEIAPCSSRSPELYTSSMAPDDRMLVTPSKRQGILSLDQSINPTFSGMNHVYARYCSSDLWTGTSTTRRSTSGGNWFFSGRVNIMAMLEILIERYGMDDDNPETRILFMGQSAGGIGAIANIDQVIKIMPKTAADGRLKLATDGGGFPRFKNEKYLLLEKMHLDEFARSNYNFFGSQLNPTCEQDQVTQGNHPAECLFISSVYPSIKRLGIPFLVIYSLHDSQMLDKHGIDESDIEAYEEFGMVSRKDFEAIDWLFAGDQPYHIITTNNQIWNADLLGETLNGVMTKFWNDESPVRVIPD